MHPLNATLASSLSTPCYGTCLRANAAAFDRDLFLFVFRKRWNMPESKHPYTIALNNACQSQVIDAHGVVSLAISQHEKDLAFLQYMFDDADWTLYKARTYRQGMIELSRNCLHVTLCECQLPDGTWKDVLSHLAPWPER